MPLLCFFKLSLLTYDRSLRMNGVKKLILISVVMGCFYGVAATHIRLVLNATPSIPYRLFVLLKRTESSATIPPKDRYVFFYHPLVQTNVIKQVKGVPGSSIRYDEKGQLWVDAFCVGKPHTTTQDGTSVKAIPPGVIPEGYVFVYAPHDRSFDSRYAAFGLIPVHMIQGVGVAVL